MRHRQRSLIGKSGCCSAALVTARAPGLLALYGIGPNTAALPLIAAGDHPGRLRSYRGEDTGGQARAATPLVVSCRAMIIRWISLVPSQMRSTRSSRKNRSATFSRM